MSLEDIFFFGIKTFSSGNFLHTIFSFNFPSENILGKGKSYRNLVFQKNVLLKILWKKENNFPVILGGKYSSDFLKLAQK